MPGSRVIELRGALDQQMGAPATASLGECVWTKLETETIDQFRSRVTTETAAPTPEHGLLFCLPK